MSLLDDIKIFAKSVVTVGKSLLNVAARTASQLTKAAKDFVDAVWTGLAKGSRSEPKTEKERIERQLQDVNERIQHLRKSHAAKGCLNASEVKQWHDLREQRNSLNELLRATEQVENAEEMIENEAAYEHVHISDDTAHILQYHVGQSAFNKTCNCGRQMVLQWKRELSTAGINDFWWGCSGFYSGHCKVTCRLSRGDLELFGNLSRPEFAVPSEKLTQAARNKKQKIRDALNEILGEHKKRKLGIAIYRCPIHGESLILRKKKDVPDNFFDEFFMGCPRWLPDKKGCNFLVKLKSAAQMSSLFDEELGDGIINL